MLHRDHQASDRVIRSIIDAGLSEGLCPVELAWLEDCPALIVLVESNRLILIVI